MDVTEVALVSEATVGTGVPAGAPDDPLEYALADDSERDAEPAGENAADEAGIHADDTV